MLWSGRASAWHLLSPLQELTSLQNSSSWTYIASKWLMYRRKGWRYLYSFSERMYLWRQSCRLQTTLKSVYINHHPAVLLGGFFGVLFWWIFCFVFVGVVLGFFLGGFFVWFGVGAFFVCVSGGVWFGRVGFGGFFWLVCLFVFSSPAGYFFLIFELNIKTTRAQFWPWEQPGGPAAEPSTAAVVWG